jgi:hypothetical protein
MADHAEDEQRQRQQGDQERHRQAAAVDHLVEGDKGDRQRDEKSGPIVVARRIEAEDETQQIDAERQHPQEGYRRHILRQMAGHRQQEDRGGHRQADPQQALVPAWGGAVVALAGRRLFAFARCSLPRLPGAAETGQDEQDVGGRPGPGLFEYRKIGLDEHRITQQGDHRCQIRERIQSIGHQARERAGIPRLHQRSGGRQQEVRHAHRRGENDEHVPGGVFESGLLPCRVGDHRQVARLSSSRTQCTRFCRRGESSSCSR